MKTNKTTKRTFVLDNIDSLEMKKIHELLSKIDCNVIVNSAHKKNLYESKVLFISDKTHTQSTIISVLERLTLIDLFDSGVISYHPGALSNWNGKVINTIHNNQATWVIDYGNFCAISLLSKDIISLFEDKVEIAGWSNGWKYKEETIPPFHESIFL